MSGSSSPGTVWQEAGSYTSFQLRWFHDCNIGILITGCIKKSAMHRGAVQLIAPKDDAIRITHLIT